MPGSRVIAIVPFVAGAFPTMDARILPDFSQIDLNRERLRIGAPRLGTAVRSNSARTSPTFWYLMDCLLAIIFRQTCSMGEPGGRLGWCTEGGTGSSWMIL